MLKSSLQENRKEKWRGAQAVLESANMRPLTGR